MEDGYEMIHEDFKNLNFFLILNIFFSQILLVLVLAKRNICGGSLFRRLGQVTVHPFLLLIWNIIGICSRPSQIH